MFKEINCHSAEYLFVESLLHSAFPEDERRDDDEQRRYTLDEDKFHTLLVSLDDEPVGLLTYWQFNGYRYIEHFAVSPQKRCGGLGDAFSPLSWKAAMSRQSLKWSRPKCRTLPSAASTSTAAWD